MTFDWREHDDDTVEYHFNPRLTIPDAMELLKGMPALAKAARQDLGGALDVRYGDRPKETLDAFPAQSNALGSPPPALIFIHGGYWRMMDKSDHSHVASDMVKDGVAHISLNYDLCPDVTLDDIVDEMRNAIIYIYSNAADLGVDENRLFLSGHSAGGHLTGMMLREDWTVHGLPADVIKGALPLSPVFEPEAIMHTSINDDVRLDIDMAERNNVLAGPPAMEGPIIAAAGALEPIGFRQQSVSYANMCRANGLGTEYYEIKSCHHFTALDALRNRDHELYQKLLAMIREA